MKIGICARTWGEKGGIGSYTRNLLEALIPLDSGVRYVMFYNSAEHLGRFRHHPNVKEVLVKAPGKFLWDQVAVPWHAAKEKVDVLFHTKFAVPLFATCKTVMVLHGSERFVYPEFSHRSDILFFKTVYPLYLKKATAIISVSENARKDVIQHLKINPSKIKTVHMAQGSQFKRITDAAALEAVRKKYRLPARYILNVGLIYPGKNIPNLLRALQLVRQKEDIKLVIAGTGRRMYEKDLKQVDELGLGEHVFLPGYIPHDDLPAVYTLADLFVFPSFYESFGLTVLEAMACGCPIVVSNTGGSPEAAGKAARYVDPWNPRDIAAGILDVLTDEALRRDLVERGFAQASTFSWATTAKHTLAVFQEIMPCLKTRTSP